MRYVLHIIVDKLNMLLVYSHIPFMWFLNHTDKAFRSLFQNTLWTRLEPTKIRQILHIIVDKLNKLLVYPHITFMWSCTKFVKCDYLAQIKLFDLVSNTLRTPLEQIKIYVNFFMSLQTSLISCLFIRI